LKYLLDKIQVNTGDYSFFCTTGNYDNHSKQNKVCNVYEEHP